MKLYTEEQVRQAFIDGMKFIAVHPLKYEQDANEYIDSLTPIELPSDEEITDVLFKDFIHRDASYKEGFLQCAKWMREQIFNKNK